MLFFVAVHVDNSLLFLLIIITGMINKGVDDSFKFNDIDVVLIAELLLSLLYLGVSSAAVVYLDVMLLFDGDLF